MISYALTECACSPLIGYALFIRAQLLFYDYLAGNKAQPIISGEHAH